MMITKIAALKALSQECWLFMWQFKCRSHSTHIYHQFLWIAFLINLCFYSGNILLPRVIDADTFGVSMECHSKGLIAVQPIMFVSFDIDYISVITLYSAYHPSISTHRHYVHLAMHGQIDGPMDWYTDIKIRFLTNTYANTVYICKYVYIYIF